MKKKLNVWDSNPIPFYGSGIIDIDTNICLGSTD